ncbi:MAG: hypothetical protein PHZ00_01965 [Candidatus Peribacteraceae bacterium]|nr:hypothetical protein [Candidatus Peribacteraceae bacterium]
MTIFRRFFHRLMCGISIASFASMIFIPPVFAAGSPVYSGNGVKDGLRQLSGLGLASNLSLTDLILVIITFILNIVLLLAVLAIIVAGVYLIVSNGDEGQKDKAKNIVLYSIAGIILILLARVIVLFVNHLF